MVLFGNQLLSTWYCLMVCQLYLCVLAIIPHDEIRRALVIRDAQPHLTLAFARPLVEPEVQRQSLIIILYPSLIIYSFTILAMANIGE